MADNLLVLHRANAQPTAGYLMTAIFTPLYHLRRAEHWVVIQGTATVQLDDQTLTLNPGESVFIPKGATHRLAAPAGEVELIEVQTGDYFGEDDIIRLADIYERT